jgi:xylitol oxidase
LGLKVLTNWAGNESFKPQYILKPNSVNELIDIVKYFSKVRAFGTLGTFNNLTGSTGAMVCLSSDDFRTSISNPQNPLVFSAGINFIELVKILSNFGLALANTPSLLDLNVIGSLLTGSHGSGINSKILAANIKNLNFVSGQGEYLNVDESGSDIPIGAFGVSLGLLGVVTNFELFTEPDYLMFQNLYEASTQELLFDRFSEIASLEASISVYTKFNRTSSSQILIKQRVSAPPADSSTFTAKLAAAEIRDMRSLGSSNPHSDSISTLRGGVHLPWFEILPHTRPGLISTGDELQSEFFFDLGNAGEVFEYLMTKYDLLKPLLRSAEIRFTAEDAFWISPSFGRDSMVIHLTWRNDYLKVMSILSLIEKDLIKLGGRPHWGKIFTADFYNFYEIYPKFEEFVQLRKILDPSDKFMSDSLFAIFN